MEKSDVLHRVVAKMIDYLIAGILCATPGLAWKLAGAMYMATSDSFLTGRSVGKKWFHLRVVVMSKDGTEVHPCGLKESLIRNSICSLAVLLGCIPWVGYIFFFMLTGLEAYFVYADENGVRLGDILANTRVQNEALATQK